MAWKSVWQRLRASWSSQHVHQEIADELAFHVEQRTADNVRAGMSPDEARREALRRFGPLTQLREAGYDERSFGWLESLAQDLRYGCRMLRRSPSFTLVAVVMISFGIGVNAAVFSVVDWLLLRPVPVKDASQLVYLVAEQKGGGYHNGFSYTRFEDVRKQVAPVFSFVAGVQPFQMDGLTIDGVTKSVWTSYSTGDYFQMLGVPPLMGRYILPSDVARDAAEPVVYLSYSCWRVRFGGDPHVVGKQVAINGHAVRVIGVAPKGFRGAIVKLNTDAYLPYGLAGMDLGGSTLDDTGHPIEMLLVGRLKPEVSLSQAQATLAVIARRLAASDAKTYPWKSMRAVRLGSAPPSASPISPVPFVSAVFLALAALVLLLGCVNVANLLLVRSGMRTREMGVRAALGASRSRLIRQMLTESVLLALLGCAGGVVLGMFASRAMNSIPIGSSLPVALDFEFDWRVFAYSVAAALASGVAVGIIPALRGSRIDLNEVLHSGGRGATGGRQRLRAVLVAAEVSGSLMLLIVAGLFTRSLLNVQRVDLGFEPDRVLNISMDPHQAGYDRARGSQFLRDMLARVQAAPGVESASLAGSIPVGIYQYSSDLKVDGYSVPAGTPPAFGGYNPVSPEYFETMGIPILRGRALGDSDDANAPRVAVINEEMARRYWHDRDPIGRTFFLQEDPQHPVQVVGIARDSRTGDFSDSIGPYFFIPFAQKYAAPVTLQVRTASSDPESAARPITTIIRAMEPAMPLFDIQSMRRALNSPDGLMLYQMGAGVAGGLGAIGLLLAMVGVYGVISYSVSQRTRDIGIRMALGASPADILRNVLRQGFVIIAIGVAAGLILAMALARVVGSLLIDVRPIDPPTFAGASLLLGAVAALASYVPARRATRVDPTTALRCE